MERRETIIRLWFDMWLQGKDAGIWDIFAEDAVYVESWGPEYRGAANIKLWFDEWNTRGRVQQWEIQQFFHREDQTVVQWYFQNRMNHGAVEAFDGMSLVKWTQDGKISFLQEFGCNVNRYNPYRNGSVPQFRQEPPIWF